MASHTQSARGLQPYPSYKPSGVEWLGDVPAHWEVRRLKATASNVVNLTTCRRSGEMYLALEHVESWTGCFSSEATGIDPASQVKQFKADDVLFGKLRPYLAKVVHPRKCGVCVGEFLVLRSQVRILSAGYLSRLLRSKQAIDAIDASTFGAKMPRAEWNFIGRLKCPLPPLSEQAAIARYLARADERIRHSIEAKEKLVGLLEEMRQALINEAVTGRFDVRTGQPYPSYKPSGVEWLGDVPAHWEVRRLGNSVQDCTAGVWGSDPNGRDDLICVRVADFDRKLWRIRLTRPTLRAITHSERSQRLLARGNLLIEKSGGGDLQPVGAVMLYDHDDLAVCSNFVARITVSPLGNANFLVYLHAHLYAIGLTVRSIKQTTGIQNLSLHSYLSETVAYPPLSEQAAIARYLDRADERIQRSIQSARRQIDLLNEYRTRLIADVVTGKLDVRQAAADLPGDPEESKSVA